MRSKTSGRWAGADLPGRRPVPESAEQPDGGFLLLAAQGGAGVLDHALVLWENRGDQVLALGGERDQAGTPVALHGAPLEQPAPLELVEHERHAAARFERPAPELADEERTLVVQRLESAKLA